MLIRNNLVIIASPLMTRETTKQPFTPPAVLSNDDDSVSNAVSLPSSPSPSSSPLPSVCASSVIDHCKNSQAVEEELTISENTADLVHTPSQEYGTIIIHDNDDYRVPSTHSTDYVTLERDEQTPFSDIVARLNQIKQDDMASTHPLPPPPQELPIPTATVSSSDVTDTTSADPSIMQTPSLRQHETDDNESYQSSSNLTSFHGLLSKRPATSSSSLLLESPMLSCIGNHCDFNESQSLQDDDTVTPQEHVIYYKRREDYYPPKVTEHYKEQPHSSPPLALFHEQSRRQSLHMILGKAVTKIHPKPYLPSNDGGMPVFKPPLSLHSHKPKAIFRKIKSLVRHKK